MRALAITILTLLSASAIGAPFGAGFPLEKGAWWEYRGTAGTVRLRTEIVDVVQRGYLSAARVKGCPVDVSGGECAFLKVGANRIYIVEPVRAAEVLRRIGDESDALVGLLSDSEFVLDLPLWPGKRIGETAQLTRQCAEYSALAPSCGYSWVVTAVGPGVYDLTWEGLTGRKVIRFASGVGIVAFRMSHGPSGSTVSLDLVDYGRLI